MNSLLSAGKRIALGAQTLALSLFATTTHAIGEVPAIGGGPGDLRQAIIDVLNAVLMFLGIIAVVVIVIAGIRLIIGGADEGQREKARNAILYAVIGLIVVFLASAIVNFVGGLFS